MKYAFYFQQNINLFKMDNHNKEAFQQMYQSSIRASYFNGMRNQFPQKSKLLIKEVDQEKEEVDQKTFTLNRNFKQPQNQFKIYQKNGRMFVTPETFFSCFSQRQRYQASFLNSKLKVTSNNKIALILDFNLCVVGVQNQGKFMELTVGGKFGRSFYLEPPPEEIQPWVDFLTEMIKKTKGWPQQNNFLADKTPDFYKFDCISNEDFLKTANSGDILLFRSMHSAARLQRIFTDSQYDHVGIILRNAKNQLFVFESSSNQGVGMTQWRHVVKYKWYQQTEKIAYRKLNMKRDNITLGKIQSYVAKTLGKGFQITMDKLFQFSSKLERTKQQDQNKTYFCSELAARLYKQLRILDGSISSTQYYPYHFSNKYDLKLHNAQLLPEQIISFDTVKS